MNNNDKTLESDLIDDATGLYNDIMKKTIARDNFNDIADEVLNKTNSFAHFFGHNNAELKRLKEAIKIEQEKIKNDLEKNEGNPEEIRRASIHYELVGLYLQYIHYADSSMSFNPLMIPPLRRLVSIGKDIIDDANHSAIFVDLNKSVSKSILNHAQYLQKDIDTLKAKDISTDTNMKSLDRRLMELEIRLDNGITKPMAVNKFDEQDIGTKEKQKEETPEHKVPYIPKLPQGEIKDRFEDRYKPQLEDADPKDLLKVAGRLKGAVNKSDLHPDDNFELNDMIKTFADGRLGKSEVYNDEKTKEITPFDNS